MNKSRKTYMGKRMANELVRVLNSQSTTLLFEAEDFGDGVFVVVIYDRKTKEKQGYL